MHFEVYVATSGNSTFQLIENWISKICGHIVYATKSHTPPKVVQYTNLHIAYCERTCRSHLEFPYKDTKNIVICLFNYVDDVTCSRIFCNLAYK